MRGYPCDEQYIEALGRAVFNFAILEYTVAYIIERLEPDYLREYISKKKTATRVAQDFAQALQRAKGHAAEAELTAFQSVFVDLKDRRDRLLHANPMAAPDGAYGGVLRHQAHDIRWDLNTVRQAATEFEDAAGKAIRLYGTLGGEPF